MLSLDEEQLQTLLPEVSTIEVDELLDLQAAAARESFWEFRKFIWPDLKISWWQYDVACHLQKFYEDFVAGKRPTIVLSSPPRHGKSVQVRDFIAWASGRDPSLKSIFASYSDDLGVRTNSELQRIYDSPRYQLVFPNTNISGTAVVTVVNNYQRNSSFIEYVGETGSFRNTTVGGQITGQGLDIGVIDDPVKGRAEASSPVTRNKVWNWLLDDFFSRFSDKAGLIMIATRWHVDDPIGRWIKHFPETAVLNYEAIASKTEKYRKKGDALFPEHIELEYLNIRKRLLPKSSWESLYQGHPFVTGGGVLPVELLRVLNIFDRSLIQATCRYVDKAGTKDGGDYTAMALMHHLTDGRFVIENITRGQWSALEREQHVKRLAMLDKKLYRNYSVGVEQEPGSGGKESAETSVRNLAGFNVFVDKVTGAKEIRAEPFAAQVQNGNVWLVAGTWVQAFWDECESWPDSKFLDQVDACSGAFNKLTLGSMYNISAMQ